MVRSILLALSLLVFAGPALADPAALDDPLLGHLAGSWVLTGTIDGQKTTQDVTARWVLHHQYIEFREVARDKQADGSPAYEATVYIGWNRGTMRYGCIWLDQFGGLLPRSVGSAAPDGNTLAFVFEGSDASRFHTTFAYDPKADRWTMNMDQEEAGKRTPFARTVLTRAP
jgi:hypothetical protein